MKQTGFYKNVFKILIPIVLQNVVTNLVNLLDNIMIGQVGTEPMSGVAIANQLFFVFNLGIFGGLAGAGIYTAQFRGKGDDRGICHTVRMKIYIGLAVTAVFSLVMIFGGNFLVNAFLHEGNEGLDLSLAYGHAMDYMHIMLIQLLPFMLVQVYASTLREVNETVLPMISSIASVLINLVGNYILIFGKFGAPALGVEGAAIATVIARFSECAILVIYSHVKTNRFPFFKDIYRSLKVAPGVVSGVMRKAALLLVNEVFWSAGMAMLNQSYSLRGLEVVSAVNIASTINQLFMSGVFSCGSVINIIVGQQLGAGKTDEAVVTSKKITRLAVALSLIIGTILVICARPLTDFYNTTDTVKALAASMMTVLACQLPFSAYSNACYFTLRSGGKVMLTFMFDFIATWGGYFVVAFCLTRFTALPIITIYILVNCVEILKSIVGFFMVRSKIWVVNLVENI